MTDTTERASDSDTALARYARSMRRQRVVYFGIVAVVVVALAIVVRIAYSRGEVANSSLHTVPKAPTTFPVEAPTSSPQVAWRTADRTAIGVPQWGGTVVVFSGHTVRGLDARTGAPTWSYTRSNRTVCTAAQAGRVTVAIYEVHGNCDEITALDSGTGTRRWTRTLDQDGMPLDGRPTYQVLPYTVLITTPSVIYALDPTSGINRWTYYHFGCTIQDAVLGSDGAQSRVLISQNCTNPRCGKLRFCGRGQQLLLRDGVLGNDDKSETNPDRIKWNLIGDTDIPVSADLLIAAINPTTRTLDALDAKKGASLGPVALDPAPSSFDRITAVSASGTEVIWVDGVTYAVRPGQSAPDWATATPGAPTVVSNTGKDDPSLPTARITVPTASGIRLLDGNDGQTAQSFAVPPPPVRSLVYPLGTGFLVSAASGTVAYR